MSEIKELSLIYIEPYNKWLKNLLKRLNIINIDDSDSDDNDNDNDNDDVEDNGDDYLLTLDPKEWKSQDHYAILGLKNKRIYATDDDIKRAYRKKVLKHHPDKRHSETAIDLDHDYYSCITRAYEILGDTIKRRSYDSIDPTFDDEIPSVNEFSKSHFFTEFTSIFKLNARWSNINPVPELGDENSSIDNVNKFYNFWYNFNSWREYSYLDEEEKDKGENREERRWMEKQNRAARAVRRKEEAQRIRSLVDNAYHCDPRIAKFKDDERREKLKLKKEKQEMIKAKLLDEENRKRETEERERRLREEEENRIKIKRDEERKVKESVKKQLRKERKHLEETFEKFHYFTRNDVEKLEHLKEFDKICKLFSYDDLVKFRISLESVNDYESKKELFLSEVKQLNNKLEKERTALLCNSTSEGQSNENQNSRKNWNYDDIQLLIKAVNLIKVGTKNRWEVIAEYVNSKSMSGYVRNHRDALEKAKELQTSGQFQTLKEEANKNAFKGLQNSNAVEESAPTQRFDSPNTYVELNPDPWTHEEQQILEQALKTFPSSIGSDRWDRIAECMPKRSRSDCIKRVRELAAMVKTKNALKATVNNKVINK